MFAPYMKHNAVKFNYLFDLVIASVFLARSEEAFPQYSLSGQAHFRKDLYFKG